jgi:hypothetical protein
MRPRQLSAEEELLLHCLRGKPYAAATPTDWDRIVALADAHGVAELLLDRLAAAGANAPEAIRQLLQQRAIAVTGRQPCAHAASCRSASAASRSWDPRGLVQGPGARHRGVLRLTIQHTAFWRETMTPESRKTDLLAETVGDDLVIHDARSHEAHRRSPTTPRASRS